MKVGALCSKGRNMRSFPTAIVLTVLVIQLGGCIGIDLIHTETRSKGTIENTEGAEKIIKPKESFKWTGLVISLFVPIPLVVPYGKESETTWIKDNKEVYHENVETRASGFGCLLLWGCGA